MEQFFGFFKFGLIPGLYHLLFMLTLPIALLLILGNEPFIGTLFLIFGLPVFRGLRNRSIDKNIVRQENKIQKQFENQLDQEARNIKELNEEYPIQVLIYPYIKELNEHIDANGELMDNETTERWVWLFFDKDINFGSWKFSPKINSMMEAVGAILIPFHDIAMMWGNHISEQYKNTGELNLHTLPSSQITEKHFYVVGPDSTFQKVGGYEEE